MLFNANYDEDDSNLLRVVLNQKESNESEDDSIMTLKNDEYADISDDNKSEN